MDRPQLIAFWKNFFSDLFLGTVRRLFVSGFLGAAAGLGALALFNTQALATKDLSPLLEWGILLPSLFWFAGLGLLGSLIAAALHIGSRKLQQARDGLNDLLDLLSHQVLGRFPKVSRDIPRDKLEMEFERLGREFKSQLKLKKSLKGALAAFLFGWVIRSLKFFFLDDVMGEIRGKGSETVSSSDIESAVRRVGVDRLMEPVTDSFLFLKILNYVLMIVLFAIPFGLVWLI